jgi:Tol biopolymer transport system component
MQRIGGVLFAVLACWGANAFAQSASSSPQVFAPGVISGPAGEDSAAFSPDGNTLVFDRSSGQNQLILLAHRVGGQWQAAQQIAPFSGRWLDHDPAMSPDGHFVVFSSNRPDSAAGKALDAQLGDGKVSPGWGGRLWKVERHGDRWGEPVLLPATVNQGTRTYSPSIAADGTLYFQRPVAGGGQGAFKLYRSAYRDGAYQDAEPLKLGTADSHELDPAIAPDQSFIVFDANYAGKDAPDRLYIAFREGDGWSKPIDLGDEINRGQPWGSHLGPDGRTLYFSSARGTRTAYPRERGQAEQDLKRMQSWDNGNDNLWSVSLAPWLDAHRQNG